MCTSAVAACMAPLLLRPLMEDDCEIENDFDVGGGDGQEGSKYNLTTMVGLDQFITNNVTLTNEKGFDAHPIRAMKFSISPVLHVVV